MPNTKNMYYIEYFIQTNNTNFFRIIIFKNAGSFVIPGLYTLVIGAGAETCLQGLNMIANTVMFTANFIGNYIDPPKNPGDCKPCESGVPPGFPSTYTQGTKEYEIYKFIQENYSAKFSNRDITTFLYKKFMTLLNNMPSNLVEKAIYCGINGHDTYGVDMESVQNAISYNMISMYKQNKCEQECRAYLYPSTDNMTRFQYFTSFLKSEERLKLSFANIFTLLYEYLFSSDGWVMQIINAIHIQYGLTIESIKYFLITFAITILLVFGLLIYCGCCRGSFLNSYNAHIASIFGQLAKMSNPGSKTQIKTGDNATFIKGKNFVIQKNYIGQNATREQISGLINDNDNLFNNKSSLENNNPKRLTYKPNNNINKDSDNRQKQINYNQNKSPNLPHMSRPINNNNNSDDDDDDEDNVDDDNTRRRKETTKQTLDDAYTRRRNEATKQTLDDAYTRRRNEATKQKLDFISNRKERTKLNLEVLNKYDDQIPLLKTKDDQFREHRDLFKQLIAMNEMDYTPLDENQINKIVEYLDHRLCEFIKLRQCPHQTKIYKNYFSKKNFEIQTCLQQFNSTLEFLEHYRAKHDKQIWSINNHKIYSTLHKIEKKGIRLYNTPMFKSDYNSLLKTIDDYTGDPIKLMIEIIEKCGLDKTDTEFNLLFDRI